MLWLCGEAGCLYTIVLFIACALSLWFTVTYVTGLLLFFFLLSASGCSMVLQVVSVS